MNKQITIRILIVSVFFGAFVLLLNAPHVSAQDVSGCATKQCLKDVASARTATAKYHDFQVALDDGFIQVSPCVEVPGVGAMGFHFLNPGLFDVTADPAVPELLLYVPDEDGVMQLVAVEYAVLFNGSNLAPTLFDLLMEGPVSHGGPLQYERHAWIWRNNPSGMFAPFNPKLSCPR